MPKRFFNILSNHLVCELQLSSSSHNAAFGGSNQINLMSCMSLGSRESSTQTVRTFPIRPMGNFSLPSILAQKQDFKRRDRRQYMALGRNASNFQSSYGCHIIKKKKKKSNGRENGVRPPLGSRKAWQSVMEVSPFSFSNPGGNEGCFWSHSLCAYPMSCLSKELGFLEDRDGFGVL